MLYLVSAVFGGMISLGVVVCYSGIAVLVAIALCRAVPQIETGIRRALGWKKYETAPVRKKAFTLGDPKTAVRMGAQAPKTWQNITSVGERVVEDGNVDMASMMSLATEDADPETADMTDGFIDDALTQDVAKKFLLGHVRKSRQEIRAERLSREVEKRTARQAVRLNGNVYRILHADAVCRSCKKPRRIYHQSGVCGRCATRPSAKAAVN